MILQNDNSDIQLISYATINRDEIKEKYLEWLNDYKLVESFGPLTFLYPKEESIIEDSFKRFTRDDSIGFFIYHIKSKTFLGTCKLDKISLTNRSMEIGIMIGEKSARGKGIGKKTYMLLLDYAFNILGFNRVWGTCYSDNIGSVKLFEATGFTKEGRERKAIFRKGKYLDNLKYSILRQEYIKD